MDSSEGVAEKAVSHQGQCVAQDDGALEAVESKFNMMFEQYRKAENGNQYKFSFLVLGVTSDKFL